MQDLNAVLDTYLHSEDAAWLAVPYRVRELYVKYAYAAMELARNTPEDEDIILQTEECGPVLIKTAAPLEWLGNASNSVQSTFGGPNPLTAMLLGSALGAGLGYGGSWLAKKLAPDYFEDDMPWSRGLPLGALLGAAIPGFVHTLPNMQAHGLEGLTTPSPLQGGPAYEPDKLKPVPPVIPPKPAPLVKDSGYKDTIERVSTVFGIKYAADEMAYGDINGVATFYVPSIAVDEWGNVIQNDPYMPPQVKAVVSGIPMAAAAAKGSWLVSPMDVAKVAIGGLAGKMMGAGIGMIAAPFLRLKPQAQTDIQRAGLLAGAFKAMGIMQ